MSVIYTRDGVPLEIRGDAVFNPRGENFGYVQGDRVLGLDGQYRGSLVDGRLVHRSTDSAVLGSARAATAGSGSAHAHSAGSAIWGDEPDIDP